MSKKNKKRSSMCSFCGKTEDQVIKIIPGPGVYICDECVSLCYEIIREDDALGDLDFSNIPKPKTIHKLLDLHVIGQEKAKKVLSVAIYNHYKKILFKEYGLEKSNILLLGPTGTGKTLLAKTITNLLHVPFAIADASSLTEAGYVGEDVENILLRLLQNSNFDIEKAENGIVYIDEFDKLTRKSPSPSLARDVSGEGVQQALLKIIEGAVANVPVYVRRHPSQEFLQVNTKNILFICGGAFDGIEEIIARRLNKTAIGFKNSVTTKSHGNLLHHLIPEDLINYGIIPEMVGRLQITVSLDPLTLDELIRILIEPVNSLVRQYQKLFKLDGVELEFEKDALCAVAKKAIIQKTGARGLRSILENALLNTMYEIPSNNKINKCIITKDTIEKNKPPLLLKVSKIAC